MKFKVWDKYNKIMITPENEGELDYNVEIYLDGTFSIYKSDQDFNSKDFDLILEQGR